MGRKFTWDMSGFYGKYGFYADNLTMREAERIFQLTPEPPKVDNSNDYIKIAVKTEDYRWFSFFLHHYEKRLNSRIRKFFVREGIDGYNPLRLLDYKMECLLAMAKVLPRYNPDSEADFLTYAHHVIGNAILNCRRHEETGSFNTLDEYKSARGIAWLYNDSGKSEKEAAAEYAAKHDCSVETAEKYLTAARRNRSHVPLYAAVQDGDGEETGEDVTCDDSWNYAEILWNGIRADAVREAFEKLNYREQTLLEQRNAVCMSCGRVGHPASRKSFEELAVMFEGSGESGAERAYRKAVEKLTMHLVDADVLGIVELKRVSQKSENKKIAAAVYEYRAVHRFADSDDEWGEIRFDFCEGTAEIVRLADGDTSLTKVFANTAIRHILRMEAEELPKKVTIPFER